jgi:hypothetical protein
MNNEFENGVEVSSHGLIESTVPVYAWGDRAKPQILSQDSRSPGRDFNLGHPGYDAGVLTTKTRR